MLDTGLVWDRTIEDDSQKDEWYWLERLEDARTVDIVRNGIPLTVAIQLFNRNYVDLHLVDDVVVVEILPAGEAALRSRPSATD